MKIHRWVVLAAMMLMPGIAGADVFFTANLTGTQEVPPSGSAATGFGRVMLNDAETQITVSVYFSGLGSNSAAGHIHGPGPAGVNAPVLFNLSPPAGVTAGSARNLTFDVTPAQVAQLKDGLWYFNIHSANLPDGETRGQIQLSQTFTTTLASAQEAPPVNSPAVGRGFVSLNPALNQALVTVRWSGLTSNASAVYLHGGQPGLNGLIICDLGAPPAGDGAIVDALCELGPTEMAAVRSNQTYFNIRTATFDTGEIRGQVKRAWSPCDFDGDGRSDKVIVRDTGGTLRWWILRSSNSSVQITDWGLPEDFFASRLLCPDVDGDGKADPTVYRSGTPSVFWSQLSGGGIRAQAWGAAGDDPRVTADYDGDGRDDFAIYRDDGVNGRYWVSLSTTGATATEQWGIHSDNPQANPDYDGDGKADLGIQRGALYWTKSSSNGQVDVINWGLSTDVMSAADYDGDGRSDLAHARTGASNIQWWIRSSLTTRPAPYGTGFSWGATAAPAARPIAADFTGDGRTDIGIWKASSGGAGLWWIRDVMTGALQIQQWGIDGDIPVQNSYWK